MTYEQSREMEKTHVCAMCSGELVTVWDAENNCERLCCGMDHSHNGYQQRLSPQKALQSGKADEAIQPGAQKDLEERAKKSQTSLSLLPREDVATKRALGILDIGALVQFAEKVGLTAHLGHVCLYHGQPYITIDGYYYLNSKRGEPYVIGTRPANAEERQDYLIENGWHCWRAEAWQCGVQIATTGMGIVASEEIEARSERNPGQFRAPVVHNHPQRMAEKRAEWQLLRKLIPLEVKE